jgi:hypothetical protein
MRYHSYLIPQLSGLAKSGKEGFWIRDHLMAVGANPQPLVNQWRILVKSFNKHSGRVNEVVG